MKTIRKRPHKEQFNQRIDLDGKVIPNTILCSAHFRRTYFEAINADHPGKTWVSAPSFSDCVVCLEDYS